jgi:hypothetical protein
MDSLRTIFVGSVAALLVCGSARFIQAGEWPKLLEHPPAGTNTILLINCEELQLGAARLKNFKNGEQKGAAANLSADIPEKSKRAAISAFVDFDSLEPVWELGTVTFQKDKLPTPKGLAEHEGGYLDPIGGRSVVWSPRGRYFVLLSADKLAVYKPADRPGVARWVRSLAQPAQPLPDYLKKASERALDNVALVLAVDMADSVSPVPVKDKLASLQSLSESKANLDELAKLLADLQGVTFSVTVEDQFMGKLQFDFGTAPGALNKLGKGIVLEVFSRRGILFPELRDWQSAVQGKSLVLSGPLDAGTVLNVLSFLRGAPSTSEAAYESLGNSEGGGSSSSKAAEASKRYFTAVQRVLSQCRDTKGLSVAERGCFNDKLSRKIDDLPMLNVDPELLDYGANIAQLIRGAGLAIRSANVATGGQKAVSSSSYFYGGYYGGFAVNNNVAYNQALTNQAHAEGMQQHLSNMQQVDTLTAEIRRKMTQKYMVEF